MKKATFTFVVLAIACVQAGGQPAVTGVSGSIQHGEEITITGTGFGFKIPAAPFLWDDFEHYVEIVEQTGSDGVEHAGSRVRTDTPAIGEYWPMFLDGTSNIVNSQGRAAYVKHDGGYGGGKHFVEYKSYLSGSYHVPASGLMSTTATGSQTTIGGGVLNAFMSAKVKYYLPGREGDDDCSRLARLDSKGFRVTAGGASIHYGYPAVWFSGMVAPVTSQRPGQVYLNDLYPLSSAEYGGSGQEPMSSYWQDRWWALDIWARCSDPLESETGFVGRAFDGHVAETGLMVTGISLDPDTYRNMCFIPHWSPGGNQQTASCPGWIGLDEVYADTTMARVFIGRNNTYTSHGTSAMQIPSAWSATEITATVNRGSFAAQDTAYVFVVDREGEASSGYMIVFGDEVEPGPGFNVSTGLYLGGAISSVSWSEVAGAEYYLLLVREGDSLISRIVGHTANTGIINVAVQGDTGTVYVTAHDAQGGLLATSQAAAYGGDPD